MSEYQPRLPVLAWLCYFVLCFALLSLSLLFSFTEIHLAVRLFCCFRCFSILEVISHYLALREFASV